MNALLRMEYQKLRVSKKDIYLYCLLFCVTLAYIIFMSLVASGNSFGGIFQEVTGGLANLVVVFGSISFLMSLVRDIQEKTIKSILITPVKRSEVIMAKLVTSLGVSAILLLILFVSSFLVTGIFFGFFSDGLYDPPSQNTVEFVAGLLNLFNAIVSTLFYANLMVCIYLSFSSLSVTFIVTILLRGVGELVVRNVVNNGHTFFLFTPLGGLNMLNPIMTNQNLFVYSLGVVTMVIYSIVFLFLSCFLFEKREF